jgi:hypothetical protein
MASFNKFQDFVEQLGKGIHQLHAAGHTLKVYLTNDTPDAALARSRRTWRRSRPRTGIPPVARTYNRTIQRLAGRGR